MKLPDWLYEEWVVTILSWVEDYPGLWTAALCRAINRLEENTQSVRYCGLCVDYANPRKRARAGRNGNQVLPGFEEVGGAYQIHGPCTTMPFRRLRGILYKLRDECLMISSEENAQIPDACNARGWDYATRWWPS